jgi:hypothetical protein
VFLAAYLPGQQPHEHKKPRRGLQMHRFLPNLGSRLNTTLEDENRW